MTQPRRAVDGHTRGGKICGMRGRARTAAIWACAWVAHSSGYSGIGSCVSGAGA